MKNSIFKFAALLAVGFGALAAAPSAQALSTLRLSDDNGATWTTIADGSGGDINGLAGSVTFSGAIGTWILNVTTGVSKPVLGSATKPHMDLNSVNISAGLGTLIIEWSDDNFGPITNTTGMLGAIGGTTEGTVTYSTFYDAGNTLFAPTTPLTPVSVGTGGAWAATTGGSLPASQSPFSLTQRVVITHGRGTNSTSFNAELKVPEGGFTLSLLGGSILALGVLRRKVFKV